MAPAQSFDVEAAKGQARRLAGQLDVPATAPNQQGRRGPRYTPSKIELLGEKFKKAARPNCKDGMPGQALGPLLILLDKKDSGCKW